MEFKRFGEIRGNAVYRGRVSKLVSAVFAVALFVFSGSAAFGQSLGELSNQLDNTASQTELLQKQVQQKAGEAATLQEQLGEMDSQIGTLSSQIGDLSAKMAGKQAMLNNYIKSDYQLSSTSTVEMLASTSNLSQFMDQRAYVQAAQDRISDLLSEILAAKKQLDSRKANLAAQQAIKAELLRKTQGEEAKYQALLADSQAAEQRLTKMIASMMGSTMVSQGHVVRGQVIGREGSSGNSTGAHVHFATYVNHVPVSPYDYLGKSMVWPLGNFEITQGFGCTPYPFEPYNAGCAGQHFHDGIDIASNYGDPVVAACSGEIIYNSFQPAGFGHYIIIQCSNGVWALTGHMQ